MDKETAKKEFIEHHVIDAREGLGWLTLVDIIYDNKPPEIEIKFIFQKWSGLKVEYTGENEQFEELLDMIYFMSKHLCELCGKSGGKTIIDGWEITLCDEHYHEIEGKVKYRPEK